MSNNKRKVRKRRRIKKSRVIILIILVLIVISAFNIAVKSLYKNVDKSSDENKTENTKVENKKDNETNINLEEKKQELEHLSLDSEKVEKKFKILIDPGHGGSKKGSTGKGGSLEKDICLEIGKKIARDLSQYSDLEIVLTRSEDMDLSIDDRVKMANSQNVDLVVSIDVNAEYGGANASGIETYYQNGKDDDSNELAKSIQDTVSLYLDSRNRGIYPTNMQILRETLMPTVMVEVGFITNEDEEKKLNDPAYQDKMAEGISQGVLAYLDAHKR